VKPLLVVDGYNVIGAWHDAQRQGWTIDESRDRLTHLLQDYAGFSNEAVVLVFDGYQSDRPLTTEEQLGPVMLVYTRRGETADSYIERYVAQVPKYRMVRVATSDGLEQSQVLSTGAVRMTSRELLRELNHTHRTGLESHRVDAGLQRRPVASHLPQATLDALEKLRRANTPDEPKPKPPAPRPRRKP